MATLRRQRSMATSSFESFNSLTSLDTYCNDRRFDGSSSATASSSQRTSPPLSQSDPAEPWFVKRADTTSARASAKASHAFATSPANVYPAAVDDLSPATSLFLRPSEETFDSRADSELDLTLAKLAHARRDCHRQSTFLLLQDKILPTRLVPSLRHRQSDRHVIPSNPHTFACLFPSMNRLEIRHDDRAVDGHLNLCVETVPPPAAISSSYLTSGCAYQYPQSSPPPAVQLFHLVVNDACSRDFSIRRYSRDSGNEVCKSSRPLPARSHSSRSSFHRSVSSALRALTGSGSGSSAPTATLCTPPVAPHYPSSSSACFGAASALVSSPSHVRPGDSGFSYDADDEDLSCAGDPSTATTVRPKATASTAPCSPRRRLFSLPSRHVDPSTNLVKLEFSNYARVQLSRDGAYPAKRYEFEWWGHRYAWRRVSDRKLPGLASFHLVRDGRFATPVAHIVPAPRSPVERDADEAAGAWVPPCYMWITDHAIVDAVTDVADIVVATGLIALVDDCIEERSHRFQSTAKHHHRFSLADKSVVQSLLSGRRHSDCL